MDMTTEFKKFRFSKSDCTKAFTLIVNTDYNTMRILLKDFKDRGNKYGYVKLIKYLEKEGLIVYDCIPHHSFYML